MAKSTVVFLSPSAEKDWHWAADFLTGKAGVTVAEDDVRKATEILVDALRAGANLPTYAARVGAVVKTKSGKLQAHGAVQRTWRHADYLHRAADHAEILATLRTGFGMTRDALARHLTATKPAMVAAGILEDKGRKAQTDAVRAAAWIDRVVKRIAKAEESGIKGTVGSQADIPAFNAGEMLRLRLDGLTGDALSKRYKAGVTVPTNTAPVVTNDAVPPSAPSSPAPAENSMPRPKGRKARKADTAAAAA